MVITQDEVKVIHEAEVLIATIQAKTSNNENNYL